MESGSKNTKVIVIILFSVTLLLTVAAVFVSIRLEQSVEDGVDPIGSEAAQGGCDPGQYIWPPEGSAPGDCHDIDQSCFPAGTKIKMGSLEQTSTSGTEINIEEIKVGDKVISQDEHGMQSVSVVIQVETPIREHMCQIDFIDGTALKLTAEHPLFVNNGWRSIDPARTFKENSKLPINKLLIGDKVVLYDGLVAEVDQISCWAERVQTYNLILDDGARTYFANSYLVHNKGTSTSSSSSGGNPGSCGSKSKDNCAGTCVMNGSYGGKGEYCKWLNGACKNSGKACEGPAPQVEMKISCSGTSNDIICRSNDPKCGTFCLNPKWTGGGCNQAKVSLGCSIGCTDTNGDDCSMDPLIAPITCWGCPSKETIGCGGDNKDKLVKSPGGVSYNASKDRIICGGFCGSVQCDASNGYRDTVCSCDDPPPPTVTPPPNCGNGSCDTGETCDGEAQCDGDGILSTGECTTSCTYCGDGVVQTGEECDDGNSVDTDTCNNSCKTVTIPPDCGNGTCNTGETCDGEAQCSGGGILSTGECTSACTYCGDGVVNGAEECDDGNSDDTDSCNNSCQNIVRVCGDGVCDTGETCDLSNQCSGGGILDTDECDPVTCTYCGDGVVQTGEECDDGNAINTDSCTNQCTVLQVECGNLTCDPGETCDGPAQCSGTGVFTSGECRITCDYCGDGILQVGEQCDDNNQIDDDACSNACIVNDPQSYCGDGIIGPGEECEPGIVGSCGAGGICSVDCTCQGSIPGLCGSNCNSDYECPVDNVCANGICRLAICSVGMGHTVSGVYSGVITGVPLSSNMVCSSNGCELSQCEGPCGSGGLCPSGMACTTGNICVITYCAQNPAECEANGSLCRIPDSALITDEADIIILAVLLTISGIVIYRTDSGARIYLTAKGYGKNLYDKFLSGKVKRLKKKRSFEKSMTKGKKKKR